MSNQNGNGQELHPLTAFQRDLSATYWQQRLERNLPAGTRVNVSAFTEGAMQAVIKGWDKGLGNCDALTIREAIAAAAELGLPLTPSLNLAYLVGYGGSCALMPSYRGMMELARRNGDIRKIEVRAAYEGESFKVGLGLNSDIQHDWSTNVKRDEDTLRAVYCIVWFTNGETQFEVMSKEEVDQIRAKSANSSSPAWKKHYVAMALKTVVKRLAKWLPVLPDLAKAISLDDQIEAGEAQHIKDVENYVVSHSEKIKQEINTPELEHQSQETTDLLPKKKSANAPVTASAEPDANERLEAMRQEKGAATAVAEPDEDPQITEADDPEWFKD